jgi:hypothetical protein
MLFDFKRVTIFPDFFFCGVVDGGVMRDPAFTEHGKCAESEEAEPLEVEEAEFFEERQSSVGATKTT